MRVSKAIAISGGLKEAGRSGNAALASSSYGKLLILKKRCHPAVDPLVSRQS